jgi:hypothetical protein
MLSGFTPEHCPRQQDARMYFRTTASYCPAKLVCPAAGSALESSRELPNHMCDACPISTAVPAALLTSQKAHRECAQGSFCSTLCPHAAQTPSNSADGCSQLAAFKPQPRAGPPSTPPTSPRDLFADSIGYRSGARTQFGDCSGFRDDAGVMPGDVRGAEVQGSACHPIAAPCMTAQHARLAHPMMPPGCWVLTNWLTMLVAWLLVLGRCRFQRCTQATSSSHQGFLCHS